MDAGTALALVSLVFDASKDLYDYYRTWKNCDKDVEALRLQLLWLHSAFRRVREILREPGLSLDSSTLVYNALGQCNDAANELRNVLDRVRINGSPQSTLDRLKAEGRRACYPFRKSTVLGLAENVETFQDKLHLAADLLNLDTTMQNHQQLQALDEKLTNGIATIDLALQPLSAIQHDTSAIRDMTTNIAANVATVEQGLASTEQRNHKQAILDWIPQADYAYRQKDIICTRRDGTGKWFLERAEFQAWIQGTHKTIFCPGNPGAGKTVIAATVVDYLMREAYTTSTAILYLYCEYKRQDEQDTEHLISALLRQAVYATFAVPLLVQETYNYHIKRNTRPSLNELRKLFQSTVENFSTVYVIVDALDECKRDARPQFLSFLRELRMQNRVRLLATSRFMPEMYSAIGADCQVEIVATNADVKRYVEGRLVELSQCVQNEVALKKRVIEVVVEAVKGMFLLARFHIDSLKTELSIKDVKKALHELPRGSNAYDETYEDTMYRICGQARKHRDAALQAIAWIARSKRPLRAVELQQALAVDPDLNYMDTDNMISIDEILSLCAGLVTIEQQTNNVRLVHYTTQEYLDRSWSQWMPDADRRLGLNCMAYLAFRSFSRGPCSNDEGLEERFAKHPLYQYCATYGGHHINAAERSGPCEDDTLFKKVARRFFLNTNAVLSATQAFSISAVPYRDYSQRYPKQTVGTHLAARFNTLGITKLLIDTPQVEVDSKDEDDRGRTPLLWAAVNGHEGVAKLLVDSCRVEVDFKDEDGQTPLSWAARNRHKGVAKLLIDTGQVDVNSKDRYNYTPLSMAAVNGAEDIAKLLIDTRQVDVDSKDTKYGQTPLSLAAVNGQEGIVKLLIDTGQVEVDSKDKYNRTPLSGAAENGHEGIVKLLIDTRQVNLDSKDEDDHTPLLYAAAMGHEGIAKLLIDTGQVDVDSKDRFGRTPLSWAIKRGHEGAAKLLIIYATNVEPMDSDTESISSLDNAAKSD